MTKSTVPQFPLRDSSFTKTCARNVATSKLKRLGFYLAFERTRQLLRTETPVDWFLVIFIALAVTYKIAATFGLASAAWLGQVVYISLALFLIFLVAGYLAQKLGLIDLAFFRTQTSKPESASEGEVYSHQRPEIPIATSMNPTPKPAPQCDELFGEQAPVPPAPNVDWQTLDIKNFGKIRYSFSTRRPGREDPGK